MAMVQRLPPVSAGTNLFFAHRGHSMSYPENTMLAYRKAVEAGAKGIEIDIVRSSDGVFYMMHDSTVDRTTNGTGAVNELTWDYLSTLDASYPAKFGDTFTGREDCKIPTLEQVLDEFQGKDVYLCLDGKVISAFGADTGKEVARMVYERGMERQVYYVSTLSWIQAKKIYTTLMVGQFGTGSSYTGTMNNILSINGESIWWEFEDLTKDMVDTFHANGLRVGVFTVDEQADIQRMIEFGVDMITTNYPERIPPTIVQRVPYGGDEA